MLGGILSFLVAICFNNVVLPIPLGPTKPYRRPNDIDNSARLNNCRPEADMSKFSTFNLNKIYLYPPNYLKFNCKKI